MYYEVYMDVLFLVNFLMDYILLLILGRILKIEISYTRICIGALAGAVLSCLVVAWHASYILPKAIAFYVVIPIIMCLLTIPERTVSTVIRGLMILYISGFLVGGIFEALYQYVQVGSLFFALAIACYYIATGVLELLKLCFHFGEYSLEVELSANDKRFSGKAMLDTGNRLVDEQSGKGVCIVTGEVSRALFGDKLPDGIRYLPYKTIDTECAMIPVVKIDALSVKGKNKQYYTDVMIAISEASSFGNDYDVILNQDL